MVAHGGKLYAFELGAISNPIAIAAEDARYDAEWPALPHHLHNSIQLFGCWLNICLWIGAYF